MNITISSFVTDLFKNMKGGHFGGTLYVKLEAILVTRSLLCLAMMCILNVVNKDLENGRTDYDVWGQAPCCS